jgi:LPS sulfotransferase NodH
VSPAPTRFIILSAPRTGSTFLRGLLGSHPDVFVGGEVFNERLTKEGIIHWFEIDLPLDERTKINLDKNLNELRQADPGRFLEELIHATHGWGFSVIGFTCHYKLPYPADPAGQYLINDKAIRVIHLKRRNLLRRLVSWERALAADRWHWMRGDDSPKLPAITLSMDKIVESIMEMEAKEKEYDECFKAHPVLEVFYEDLAEDPQAVGARALDFLGLKADRELHARTEKTGVDSLRTAVENYDELKSSLRRWASFFEE